MLKQKRVLKLCLGLLAFGITVSFSNLNRFGYFKNMVKAMEDVPASGLQIYKQNKENVKNVNGCYVRYPSENSVWPGGYGYFYLDFSNFLNDEQKKRLKDLKKQGCYVFGDVISPGNVDVKVLQDKTATDGFFLDKDYVFDSDVCLTSAVLGGIKKVLVKGRDDELMKLVDELACLEINGRLFKYNELVNSLSASVNGKRYYDFKNVENNKRLYEEIVSVVKYLSDLALRQKSALIEKGMWYYNTESEDNEVNKAYRSYIEVEREFLGAWINHLSAIGAFLEKFFGFGKVFYQEENDKYAKRECYRNNVFVYDIALNCLEKSSEQIVINIFFDYESNELLLKVVGGDGEEYSYRTPVNENMKSNTFNFLVEFRKKILIYWLSKNPELAEKKDELISLLDKSIVVKNCSNKLDINSIHMDKDVLGQIVEDVISEIKELSEIKDIVQSVVYKEVGNMASKIRDKIFKDNEKTPYSVLKNKFLEVLDKLSDSRVRNKPKKVLEDISKNINSEFKNRNIDPIILRVMAGQLLQNYDFYYWLTVVIERALEHEKLCFNYRDVYEQNKENVKNGKNVNGCYVRYPEEYGTWPEGYKYFYLDFSAFQIDEQKGMLGEFVSPGNVSLSVLKAPNNQTVPDYVVRFLHDFEIKEVKKILVKNQDYELIKLLDELSSLEKYDNGRLFKYKDLVNSLSASVNGKRCYDFKNVKNNEMLYKEIVNLVDYLSDLALRQKNALRAKGMWYYNTESENNKVYRAFLIYARGFLEMWIKHLSAIGAFLERFFGFGKLFYQEENDKYSKYEYYLRKLIDGGISPELDSSFWEDRIGYRTIYINIVCENSNELLLKVADRDDENYSCSYNIPVNEYMESNIFNLLLVIKKLKAKCLLKQDLEFAKLKQDPKFGEEEETEKLISLKEKLISLIDETVVVKDESGLNISSIRMGKDVLDQIVEDAISETKKSAKIKDIVHYEAYNEVHKEVDNMVRSIKDTFKDESGKIKIPYSEFKAKVLIALENLRQLTDCSIFVSTELIERIYENINNEIKNKNIDEIKLERIFALKYGFWDYERAIRGFITRALKNEIEMYTINLDIIVEYYNNNI